MTIKPAHLAIAAAGIGAALIYYKGVAGVTAAVSRAAVNLVGGGAVGVVHGASDLVGLPTPDRTKCDIAKANGDKWAASFDCPVGEFLGFVFD